MLQLILSGVFDRFPEIRFYFAETNASWIPWTLYQLDNQYRRFKDNFGVSLARKPSEYILEHCRFGFVDDPWAVQLGDEAIPSHLLMWGSDFPHAASTFPTSRSTLEQTFAGVDEARRRAVLLDNPAAHFGLDLDADITSTPA
jgi:predicted TIM-barrel fold metal-dependent hydrolase